MGLAMPVCSRGTVRVHPEVVGDVGQVRPATTHGMLPDRAIRAARSARHRAGGEGAARRADQQQRDAWEA